MRFDIRMKVYGHLACASRGKLGRGSLCHSKVLRLGVVKPGQSTSKMRSSVAKSSKAARKWPRLLTTRVLTDERSDPMMSSCAGSRSCCRIEMTMIRNTDPVGPVNSNSAVGPMLRRVPATMPRRPRKPPWWSASTRASAQRLRSKPIPVACR